MKSYWLINKTLEVLEMTQAELGAELGLGQSYISGMLSGDRTVKKYHILALEGLLARYGFWPLT